MTSDPNDTIQTVFDLPSVDASGACTCCGYTWFNGTPLHEPTGDETPCACLGDDCEACGACLLAHCACDPGELDEDQMTPARPVESSGMWPS